MHGYDENGVYSARMALMEGDYLTTTRAANFPCARFDSLRSLVPPLTARRCERSFSRMTFARTLSASMKSTERVT